MKLRAVWTAICLVGLLAIGGAAASSASAESLCTDTWTGPSEGAWETASDWSTGKVPGSLDVACIGSGKKIHVASASQAVAVVQGEGTLVIWSGGSLELASALEVSRIHGFEMNGGTLAGAGTLEVSGSFEWKDEGTLAGSGSFVIEKGASGVVKKPTGPFESHVVDRLFVNQGTVTENAESALVGGEGTTITNKGTFIADGYGVNAGAGAAAQFVNEGTFEQASATTTRIQIAFVNDATVKVASGILSLEHGGSSGSNTTWSASEGAEITLIGGSSYTFSGGSWSGKILLSASATVEGVSASGAHLGVDGILTLPTGSMTVATFTLSGVLTGAGTLKVASTLKFEGSATMSGSGSTVLEKGGTGEISKGVDEHNLHIIHRSLINEGTITYLIGALSGTLTESEGAVITNLGTFNANTFLGMPENDTSKIINRGVFQKTEGTETAQIQPYFENFGSIRTLTGKLEFKHLIEPERSTQYGAGNRSALSSVKCKVGDPVDCATGNFYESQTDIAAGGRGVGMNLARYYNAQAAAAGEKSAFGYGWTSSFSERLTFNTTEHKVTVVQDEGSTVTFAEEGGKLVAPAWTQDTLTGNGTAGYTLTMNNETVYKFSGAGRLESITDRNGNKTSLSYNEKGQLTTITDPSSRKITLAYNAEGLVESATDPMSHVVKYAYESGQLTSVTLPSQTSPRWRFKYDTSHRITGVTDGRGNETTNTYNSANQVVSQKDFAGHVIKWEYEPFVTKVTNETTGSVTLEEYTSEDQLSGITYGYGTSSASTESFTYNERGEPLTRTDGNGHTTSYEYDSEGDRTKQTDPEGHETTWTDNTKHEPTSETLPSGEKTTIEYDEHGNPVKVSRPAPEEKTQVTRYEYNSLGELTAMIDPLERKWSYGYDEAGDRTSETDPEGDKTTWGYNKDSQRTTEVSPRGNVTGGEPSKYTTTLTRNVLGQVTKVTQPEGQETSYTYNANNNLIGITDPNGHKTTIGYTADGLPTKVTQPNGAVTETTYNGANLVAAQIDGNKHFTKYLHNPLGQVSEIIDPLEHKTKVTYDAAGNLATVVDAAGRTTTYSYNKENQPTKITYSDGVTPTVEYGYTPNGQVSSMIDGTGTTSYTYDQLGRMIETKNGHGDTAVYGYDLASQVTSIKYPNGKTVKDGYDKTGRLSTVSDWLSHTITIAYSPNSLQTTVTFPETSSESDHYAYNRTDQLTEASMLKGSETLASIAYARDLNGQVTKGTQTGLPGEAATEYGYDVNERLTKAGGTVYEYDAANNPTKIGSATNTFNADDMLLEGGGVSYTYNNVGQRVKATPTSGPATTYGYNQAGDLTSAKRPEEGSTPKIEDTYAYDGNGLRASETINGATKHLTWQPTGSLPLLLGDGTNSYIYGPEGVPIEQINTKEEPTYLHHDQAGSTRLITSSAGTVEGAYTYTPYGGTEAHTGTATTPLGYDGQYTSPDTGLIYLRARTYDPTTAQFMSVDPISAFTRAPYTYAGDNPITFGDPTGLFPWEAVAEGLGVGASCLLGPEVCVPAGLFVIDVHVIRADVNSVVTGCSPWPEITPALVAGGVSTLPFAGGLVAKDVWEASRAAFRIGATGGIASGGLAGAAAASNSSVSCGC